LFKPTINYKKCKVHGICIQVCPVSVYEKEGKKVVVKRPEDCIGCKSCEASCPEQAITVKG